MTEFKEIYNTLRKVDMRDRVLQKNGLDYLPWATAWDEVAKLYNADYKFCTFDNSNYIIGTNDKGEAIYGGKEEPYLITTAGLMVATEVTIEGHTRRMQLPDMDFKNTSMHIMPREVGAKNQKVSAATMNDINKASMRCLAKNIAMFGLMINLWTKEDIPDAIASQQKAATEALSLVVEKKKAAQENGDENAIKKVDETFFLLSLHRINAKFFEQ